VVSVVHVLKGAWAIQPLLDGRPVARISAFLVEGDQDATPAALRANAGVAFVGSYLLGMGFTFDDETNEPAANSLAEMRRLIAKDSRNTQCIRPYIGGEEVNDSPEHGHHRYAINFADFPLRRENVGFSWVDAEESQRVACLREGIVPMDYPDSAAADWPDLLELVRAQVKSERDRLGDSGADARRRKKFWWLWGRYTPGLYHAVFGLERVLAISRVNAHFGFAFLPAGMIFSEQLIVQAVDTFGWFALLQSRIHEIWARFFASSLEDRLRYTPSDCFETFPLPFPAKAIIALEGVGQTYYEARAALMQATNRGLTATYNRFNDPGDHDPAIGQLRDLHAAMDRAALDAYDWTDLIPLAIHEREWEAEEGEKLAPWRLRWPEPDRDEVLARLLDLNHRRHEEELREIPPPNSRRRGRGRGRNSPPSGLPLLD
jgi:hypothetical protein